MAKRIFVAATRQNEGKTTICLGLIFALKRYFRRIGFIKPIGQRYLIEQGYKIDEDSILIERLTDINCKLKDMSPIAIEKNFTEKYINRPNKEKLKRRIEESFERIAKDKDLVIIEGTGHAGVGSCFDWSNANVAKLLDSKVILVTGGGIGRPIDEIALNQALFEKEGVEILGIVVNKVKEKKYKKIDRLSRKRLRQMGLEVLGVLPYKGILSAPTMRQIMEEIGGNLLYGRNRLGNIVENILVAAMFPHGALRYLKNGDLIITPGDREDIILAIMSMHTFGTGQEFKIAGLVLTGGIVPDRSIIKLIKKTDIPVILSDEDTYTVAKKIHDRMIKIQPQDLNKARIVRKLIEDYVDIEKIVTNI